MSKKSIFYTFEEEEGGCHEYIVIKHYHGDRHIFCKCAAQSQAICVTLALNTMQAVSESTGIVVWSIVQDKILEVINMARSLVRTELKNPPLT